MYQSVSTIHTTAFEESKVASQNWKAVAFDGTTAASVDIATKITAVTNFKMLYSVLILTISILKFKYLLEERQ